MHKKVNRSSPVLGITAFVIATHWMTSQAEAGPVLNWDPSPDPNIVGYAVYYAEGTSQEFVRLEVGNTTQASLDALAYDRAYQLYITGVTKDGNESVPSNFVMWCPVVNADNNRVLNGSFEQGYDHWIPRGSQAILSGTSSDGERAVVLNAETYPNDLVLAQTVATQPGLTYHLSFDVRAGGESLAHLKFDVSVVGAASWLSTTVEVLPSQNPSGWQTQQLEFVAEESISTLSFHTFVPTNEPVALWLDSIRITPAP